MIKIKKKNIFLTGGGGYIGRNILEGLGDRYQFFAPRHNELDLLDTQAVDRYFHTHKIDIVIHAAVVGGSRKGEHVDNSLSKNMRMFFNIIRNKKNYKKLIVLGSGAEYDKSRPLKKIKEDDFDKRIPTDDYGLFKYLCSKYIETQSGDIVNLRLFGMFGKYENYSFRFISNAIAKNLLGLPITIKQNVIFDYVYIKDFVKIIDHFISHNAKHKFYNIGSGNRIDLITITKKINAIATKKSKITVKNKGLNNEYSCDNTRLRKELGKFTFANFDESLHELYNWYASNKSLIEKSKI